MCRPNLGEDRAARTEQPRPDQSCSCRPEQRGNASGTQTPLRALVSQVSTSLFGGRGCQSRLRYDRSRIQQTSAFRQAVTPQPGTERRNPYDQCCSYRGNGVQRLLHRQAWKVITLEYRKTSFSSIVFALLPEDREA